MIQKVKNIFYTVVSGALFAPALALAQFKDGLDKVDPGELGIAEGEQGAAGIASILIKVIQFALGFLAALAVLVIIIAGIIYITSGGNEDRVQSAKGWLLYAIVGLVIALLGWVIVSAVSDALIAA